MTQFKAKCLCGKEFTASWYRLDAVGPVCDDCLIIRAQEQKIGTEYGRETAGIIHDERTFFRPMGVEQAETCEQCGREH